MSRRTIKYIASSQLEDTLDVLSAEKDFEED